MFECVGFVPLFCLCQRNVIYCNRDWKERKKREFVLKRIKLFNGAVSLNHHHQQYFKWKIKSFFFFASIIKSTQVQLFLIQPAPQKLIRMNVWGIVWLFVSIFQSNHIHPPNKPVLWAIEFSVRSWTPFLSPLTTDSKRQCTLIGLVKIFVSCDDLQIKFKTIYCPAK